MLCVPSARHLFGTASLASSALSASAELLVIIDCRHIVPPWSSPLQSAALHSHLQVPKRSPVTNQELVQPSSSISYGLEVIDSRCQDHCAVITDAVAVAKTENYFRLLGCYVMLKQGSLSPLLRLNCMFMPIYRCQCLFSQLWIINLHMSAFSWNICALMPERPRTDEPGVLILQQQVPLMS